MLCNQCVFKTLLNGPNADLVHPHTEERYLWDRVHIKRGKNDQMFSKFGELSTWFVMPVKLPLFIHGNWLGFCCNSHKLAWVVRVIRRIRSWLCSVPLTADKTIKLWKISERDKRPEGYNLKEEDGRYRDAATITGLRVSHARLSTLVYALIWSFPLFLGFQILCIYTTIQKFPNSNLLLT